SAEEEPAGTQEQSGAETENVGETSGRHILSSPFNGQVYGIERAPDEAFASRMMGDGYVVFPEDGQVKAPEDGQVLFVFPSRHAIGLKTEDGMEYLLHIGVDTVKLDGKGFQVFVADGQKVKKGDLLMEF